MRLSRVLLALSILFPLLLLTVPPATADVVHLRTGDASTILRRPFSIARVRGEEVVLLYRIIGEGTRWMRALEPGDRVNAMGPLGTVFRLRTSAARTLLVGGGLGIAPLLGLAQALSELAPLLMS